MSHRSYHFIPANKPSLFDRINSLGADAYIFDLEDAVADEEKFMSLSYLRNWLQSITNFSGIFIRINQASHFLATQERELIHSFPEVGVVIPKVESSANLLESAGFLCLSRSRRVIGLIESSRALMQLDSILETRVLSAIGLGLEDFLSDSIFEVRELPTLVASIRTRIAISAMAHGMDAIDTVSLDLEASNNLLSDIHAAKSAGMTSKFSIHPSQIDPINMGFSPSYTFAEKARNLETTLMKMGKSQGYFMHQNEIFSPPKIKKLNTVIRFLHEHEE